MMGIDGQGVYGQVFQWAFTFALIGSALLVFLYLWRMGRLDMDESPKMQMFEPDHDGVSGGRHE